VKKGWQIFWHIISWICIIAFFTSIARYSGKMTPKSIAVIFGLYGIINISVFYVNYLVLIPNYLNRKRYKLFALSIIATLVAYGLVKYGFGLIFRDIILDHNKGEPVGFWKYFLNSFFITLIFLFLSTVLKFTIDWFLNERVQRDLENQRLSAELSFLKSLASCG